MLVEKHLQNVKSILQKSKNVDTDGHVSDWIALLHYQDNHDGDGLYAPMHVMQTWIRLTIEVYIESLDNEEALLLTQEAYDKSYTSHTMDCWKGILDEDLEPKEAGLIVSDAIAMYLDEKLWQLIDDESMETEVSDELDLEECDEGEIVSLVKEELESSIKYNESKDVQEFALKLMPYIERLEDLLLNKE